MGTLLERCPGGGGAQRRGGGNDTCGTTERLSGRNYFGEISIYIFGGSIHMPYVLYLSQLKRLCCDREFGLYASVIS